LDYVVPGPGGASPEGYTVFGEVIDGLDVALKISNMKTFANGSLHMLEELVELKIGIEQVPKKLF
jgi:cyclophilin family peptidyl-prolyl cis-trans isomerase